MRRRAILPLVAGLGVLAAHPALALQAPRGGHADVRVKTVDYDPAQVVLVTAALRTATQILFAPEETIAHVALGDGAAWDVAAEKNILFLKPKAKSGPTNLIVTTDRGAETRSYLFQLALRTRARGRQGDYALRFRYPSDDRGRARAVVGAAQAALERRVIELKLERGAVEGPRNLAYSLQGPAALAPAEVSDNGRFTVLRFPGAQPLPAIYTVGTDGAEALAAFDVRGDILVVHGTAPGLRLRRGRQVLCITNDAWRPYGAPTGTHTAAPDIVRTEQGEAR